MTDRSIFKALPIVAAGLGERFGVRVRIGGNQAATDGKEVILPVIPPDSPFKNAIWGYLVHECGHIRHTNFDIPLWSMPGLKKVLVNIFEDIRIEKMMISEFPGVGSMLLDTEKHIVSNDLYERPSEEHGAKRVLVNYLLFWVRKHLLGELGEPLTEHLMQTEPYYQKLFPVGVQTRLKVLMRRAGSTKSTEDCLNLAEQVLLMLKEEQEKEQANSNQNQNQQSQDDSDSAQDQQDGQQGQDDSDSAQDQQDGQQGQGGSGNDQDQQDGQQGQSGSSDSDSDQAASYETTLSSVLNDQDADDDIPKDVMEALKEQMSQEEKDHKTSCHGSYDYQAQDDTGVYQTVFEAPLADIDEQYGPALMQQVSSTTSSIRAKLYGLVQASQLRKPVARRTGRRLETSQLCRLSIGDTRVFRKEEPKIMANTAVHILSDLSGSMSGHDEEVCRQASLSIALALESLQGVNPAVTYFRGEDSPVVTALKHGQSARANAYRFNEPAFGLTPMADALWYAAFELSKCRELRKMVLVITDGRPCSMTAVKKVVEMMKAAEIEVLGIGIGNGTCVSALFDTCIEITEVDDLTRTLFDLMRNHLVSAA